MRKVKHILDTFIHSFVPQDIYYPKLLHRNFIFSLKYGFTIIVFFSLIFTGIILYRLSPFTVDNYQNSLMSSLSRFPQQAKISIKNGVLEFNQNSPLFLWIYNGNQPFFVFTVSPEDVSANSHIPLPLVSFSADKIQLSYMGNILTHPYGSKLNVEITKNSVQKLMRDIQSSFPFFVFIFYGFLMVAMPLIFILFSLFTILLFSAVVWILLRTFIPHIHFKKCIQAGLHGTHIPFVVSLFLFSLFPLAGNNISIAVSLIFVFTLVATYEMYSKQIAHLKGR